MRTTWTRPNPAQALDRNDQSQLGVDDDEATRLDITDSGVTSLGLAGGFVAMKRRRP
jgi:hypothetical protein